MNVDVGGVVPKTPGRNRVAVPCSLHKRVGAVAREVGLRSGACHGGLAIYRNTATRACIESAAWQMSASLVPTIIGAEKPGSPVANARSRASF